MREVRLAVERRNELERALTMIILLYTQDIDCIFKIASPCKGVIGLWMGKGSLMVKIGQTRTPRAGSMSTTYAA